MARQAGSKSTVAVNLSTLTERLSRFGDVPIQVGKGWADAMQTALNVDFGIAPDESAELEVSDAPATVGAGKVVVE